MATQGKIAKEHATRRDVISKSFFDAFVEQLTSGMAY
jgi:hypothetical protein